MEADSFYDIVDTLVICKLFTSFVPNIVSLDSIFGIYENSFGTKRKYFSAFPRMTAFLKVYIRNTETNAIRDFII